LAEVQYFAHGWLGPALAVAVSFFGCLVGLLVSARARESDGPARARWLCLAAVSIGGTGFWLMRFLALLGFDVPDAPIRYDVKLLVAGLVIVVAAAAGGLLVVGLGEPTPWKVAAGGGVVGLGLAAMHLTTVAGMRLSGTLVFRPAVVVLALALAVVAATIAMWLVVAIRGTTASAVAALIMAVAVSVAHYTAMAAIGVVPGRVGASGGGVSLFLLFPAVSLVACVVMLALGYGMVGHAMRRDNARQEAALAHTRHVYEAAAVGRLTAGLTAGPARHR